MRSTAPMSRVRVARVDAGYLGGWQHEQRSDDVHQVDRVVVSPRSQSHRVAITTAPGSTTTRDRPRAFRHAT